MRTKWIAAAGLVAVLAIPVAVWAHGGHTHKVMGTVTSVEGNHLEVRTTDGKTVMVMLNQKTKITRGKTTLDAAALKPGERVSIDAAQEKDMMMAQAIKVGAASTAAVKK